MRIRKQVVFFLLLGLFTGYGLNQVSALTLLPVKSKPKIYEGLITQFNLADGSLVVRLRDGSFLTIANPFPNNTFVSFTGIVDQGILQQVSDIKIKDANATDIIPEISLVNPGSGQVNTAVTLHGRGFTKKNTINIGTVKNAILNLPTKDGKTLKFQFPATPCNQKITTTCPRSIIPAGSYDLSVTNQNGVSNVVPFTVTPLAPLQITTDVLPQLIGGSRSSIVMNGIGGAESYNWQVTQGALPPGLKLMHTVCASTPCQSGATISGVPTIPNTYQFTITLTSGAETTAREFVLKVVQPLSNPGWGY